MQFRLMGASLGALLVASAIAQAQTYVDQEHVDIGFDITFEENAGTWSVPASPYIFPNPFGPLERDLQATILVVNSTTATFPNDPPFAGAYNSLFDDLSKPVYHLDQNEVIDGSGLSELYLGVALEELNPSQWQGEVTLELVGLDGPGDLVIFSYPFSFLIDSRDGLSTDDALALFAGSHRHTNWVYTAPGDYTVTLRWTGTLSTDGSVPAPLRGEQVQATGAFRFHVESICAGDANGDSRTDLSDIQVVLFNFGCTDCTRSQGDLNRDGAVDLSDLQAILFDVGCGA